VDASLAALRQGGLGAALPAMAGGLVASLPVLFAFYLERVEGVRSLRPLLGFLLVLGFWGRALLGARAARRAIKALWPTLPLAADGGQPVDVIRTASVAGVGLFAYLFLFAGANAIWPGLVFFILPVLVFRGVLAPSWVASAATSDAGGLPVFLAAAEDNGGRRVQGLLIEALLLAGTAVFALNVYAFVAVGLLLVRSFLGIDLASVDAFMSLRNPLVGAAILTTAFIAFEPLRVSLAAFAYVDVRVRRRGLDLAAAIDDAVAAAAGRAGPGGRPGPSAATGGIAAVLFVACLVAPLSPTFVASAQVHGASDPVAASDLQHDSEVRAQAREILARPEFIELEDPEGRDFGRLIAQFLDWLANHQPDADFDMGSGFALPMPPMGLFLFAGAALLLIVVAYLFVSWRTVPKKAVVPGPTDEGTIDPRERAPEAHLDDAAGLAAGGHFRQALRSLYLATLVALDRRRLITFDPARTNWHYLRQLPQDARRGDFSRFTRLFDHKWYGDEQTTRSDYDECRALADRIVAPGDVQ